MDLSVYSLPTLVLPEALNGTVAVVIDVLRATSVAAYAAASGIESLVTLTDIEQARRLKAALEEEKPDSVLLGGERKGLPIDGFDLGNSPQHYMPERVKGKTLILTTTNGTFAVQSALSARKIYLAAFLNAQAVAELLKNEERVAFICAGTDGRETEEDLLLAGCLVSRLLSIRSAAQLNETAKYVRQCWEERPSCETLEETLRRSRGGQNLISIGLEEDIAVAACTDSIRHVLVRQFIPGNLEQFSVFQSRLVSGDSRYSQV